MTDDFRDIFGHHLHHIYPTCYYNVWSITMTTFKMLTLSHHTTAITKQTTKPCICRVGCHVDSTLAGKEKKD